MDKWKTTVLSLIISAIFAVACYFMPSQVNLFGAVVVSILTFLIPFVFVELSEHIKRIQSFDTNNEYKFFKECGISEYKNDFSSIDFTSCISGANHIRITLLYSNRFPKNYINDLRKFVSREGSTLEFIILSDEKDCNAYKYISKKLEYGENALSEKLQDFTDILSSLQDPSISKMRRICSWPSAHFDLGCPFPPLSRVRDGVDGSSSVEGLSPPPLSGLSHGQGSPQTVPVLLLVGQRQAKRKIGTSPRQSERAGYGAGQPLSGSGISHRSYSYIPCAWQSAV